MGGGNSKGGAKKVSDIYSFKEAIGRGSFATVYEAELLEKDRCTPAGKPIPKLVAVKAIDKSKIPPDEICLLQEECTIMSKLNHPNVVGLLESFDEPEFFYIILELVRGGELFDQIVAKGYFNEVEAAHATRQIAQALAYLEELRICHRDIKPENLIFESNDVDANIKVTDFGLAKDISGFEEEYPLNDPCGTPGYVAPEILNGKNYGCKVDTWALGVVLFILLCGYPPFYSEDQQELFDQIKKCELKFESPYWDDISKGAKDVILKLLQVDPAKRLTARQLLQEEWVANPEAQKKQNFGEHYIDGIKEVQCRKLKRAVFKIRAMNQFSMVAAAFSTKNMKELADQAKAEGEEEESKDAAPAGDDETATETKDEKEEKPDEKASADVTGDAQAPTEEAPAVAEA